MMKIQLPAEQTILFHCLDERGFMGKLTLERVFDEQAYRDLVQAMAEYRDAVSEAALINRQVAGCLHSLVYGLLLEMLDLEESAKPALDIGAVRRAHAECWELVQQIFSQL